MRVETANRDGGRDEVLRKRRGIDGKSADETQNRRRTDTGGRRKSAAGVTLRSRWTLRVARNGRAPASAVAPRTRIDDIVERYEESYRAPGTSVSADTVPDVERLRDVLDPKQAYHNTLLRGDRAAGRGAQPLPADRSARRGEVTQLSFRHPQPSLSPGSWPTRTGTSLSRCHRLAVNNAVDNAARPRRAGTRAARDVLTIRTS